MSVQCLLVCAILAAISSCKKCRSEKHNISFFELKLEMLKAKLLLRRDPTMTERRQILDNMINMRLVLQAADKENIPLYEGETNRDLKRTGELLAKTYPDIIYPTAKNEAAILLGNEKNAEKKNLVSGAALLAAGLISAAVFLRLLKSTKAVSGLEV